MVMFYICHILIIFNYISNLDSSLLKRIGQSANGAIKQYEKCLIPQDIHNNSFHNTTPKLLFKIVTNSNPSSNLKVNMFEKRLSDEMLSIKKNIYNRKVARTPTKYISTKDTIDTSILESKQVWSAMKLLSKSDHRHQIVENRDIIDNLDLKQLMVDEHYNESPYIDRPLSIKHFDSEEEQHNQTKNKIVDRQAPSDMNQPITNNCSCCKNSINGYPLFDRDESGYSSDSTVFHKCHGCTRTTIMYSLMPFYIQYEPYFHYPSHIFKEDSREPSHDDLYYNDGKDENAKISSDEKNYDYFGHFIKKRKKHGRGQEEIQINMESDVKTQKTIVKWDTAFLKARPNKLVKDLIEDLSILYPDTIIKTCYCSSSSTYSGAELTCIVALLIILTAVFFRILKMK